MIMIIPVISMIQQKQNIIDKNILVLKSSFIAINEYASLNGTVNSLLYVSTIY
jgi:hypothetical protein